MNELIVRLADADDVHRIAAIEKLSFAFPWSAESILEEIERDDASFYIVAEINGQVVGYGGIMWIAGEGHITNIAVDPLYRKKHIAEGIMTVMLDYSMTNGIDMFTLEVRVSNEPAIALYEKFGFEKLGIRPKYYIDNGEDAVIMSKFI